jgi:RNA polymerase sigma-70 factor (ECF subfamily)
LRQDRKAQRMLYNRFAGKMLAACLRYCGNRTDAEDCLLQGFEKVFAHLASYQGQGSLEGWVRRIMVREALQHLRKRSLLFVQTETEALPEAQTAGWADAAEHLAIEDVLAAVARLPEGCRTVFNLAGVEGFRHDEIASMLGISEATSRSQLFRARQLLQKLLTADAANLAKTHR